MKLGFHSDKSRPQEWASTEGIEVIFTRAD